MLSVLNILFRNVQYSVVYDARNWKQLYTNKSSRIAYSGNIECIYYVHSDRDARARQVERMKSLLQSSINWFFIKWRSMCYICVCIKKKNVEEHKILMVFTQGIGSPSFFTLFIYSNFWIFMTILCYFDI